MDEVFRVEKSLTFLKEDYKIEKHLGKYYHFYKWTIIVLLNILPALLIAFNWRNWIMWLCLAPLYLPLFFIDIFAMQKTIQYIYYFLKIKLFEFTIILSNYFVVRCGCPGSGKTSSSIMEAYVLACRMWIELKWAYLTTCLKWKWIQKSGDKKKIESALFIFKSYNFWNTHKELIPCLCSNIDIKDKFGREVYHIDKDNLLQKRPIPYMSVIFYDEIGLDFPCSNSSKNREKWRPVATLGRLTRHFGEFHFIITEQDKTNVFKDLRRVVSENRTMQKQEWVCRAGLLDWVYNYLRQKVIDYNFGKYDEYSLDKVKKRILSVRTKIIVQFLIRLNVMVRACGFRRYRYISEGNLEFNSDDTNTDKVKTFVLPSLMEVSYDDKYYAKDYTIREQEFREQFTELKTLHQSA